MLIRILVIFCSDKNELIALDFGCMKIIPNEFYVPYFELIDPQVIDNAELFRESYLN
jgi:hypothetical protein